MSRWAHKHECKDCPCRLNQFLVGSEGSFLSTSVLQVICPLLDDEEQTEEQPGGRLWGSRGEVITSSLLGSTLRRLPEHTPPLHVEPVFPH